MNLSLWSAMREYIVAEVQLAMARNRSTNPSEDSRVRELEEQSTRMETAVREEVAKIEAFTGRVKQVVTRHTLLK